MDNTATTRPRFKKKFKPRFNKRPGFNKRPSSTSRYNKPQPFQALEVKVDCRGDSEEAKTEALEKALARLKKILIRDGRTQTMKEREYFISPSRKRYIKRKQILYKRKVKMMKKGKKFRKR